MIRESRYSRSFLRSKNATGGADGERQLASIRKVRRSLADSLTDLRQIAIESTVVERSQFDLDRPGIARDGAGELEEWKQTMPGRMGVRSRKVLVTHPCRFQRKREREMSLNRQDQAVLSAKKFNRSAKKGHIFS